MADKELRQMSRSELIEIIYAVQQEEQSLRRENEELKSRLEDRQIRIDKAGSIAEASLSLNHIFEDAQAAAEQYLQSVKGSTKIQADAANAGEETIAQAQKQARQILADAQKQADEIRRRGEQAAAKEREQIQRSLNNLMKQNPELAAAVRARSKREDNG